MILENYQWDDEVNTIFEQGSIELLTSYLDAKPYAVKKTFKSVDSWNRGKCTLLELSVDYGRLDFVQLLVTKGADIASQADKLLVKILSDRVLRSPTSNDLIKLILENGAQIKRVHDLDNIFVCDDIETFELLIEYGFDPVSYETINKFPILYRSFSKTKYSNRIIKSMIEMGCITFTKRSYDCPLEQAITRQKYELVEFILDSGLDLERLIKRNCNSLLRIIAMRYSKMPQNIFKRLLLDSNDEIKSDEVKVNILNVTVENSNIQLLKYLLNNGHVDINQCQPDSQELILSTAIINNDLNMCTVLIKRGIDLQQQDAKGNRAIKYAVDRDNIKILSLLLESGAEQTDDLIFIAIKNKNKELIKLFMSLNINLNALNKDDKTPLDIALEQSAFKQVCRSMVKAGAKTSFELNVIAGGELDTEAMFDAAINDGEPWTFKAKTLFRSVDNETQLLWLDLIRQCLDNNSPKPSKKWLKDTKVVLDEIGDTAFKEIVLQLFPLVKQDRTDRLCDPDYGWSLDYVISDNNTRLLKGLIWLSHHYSDIEMSNALRSLAKDLYTKVHGIGMRNAKLANAAIYSLSLMSGSNGIKELITLRAITKYNPALTNINRVFDKLAEQKGISADELAELSTPDYGLTQVGLFRDIMGIFNAELKLTSVGKCELIWKTSVKHQKSIPAEVKKKHAVKLANIKRIMKDVQIGSRAHCQRIEQMYLRTDSLDMATWKEQYVNHKLIGFLARNLIWRIKSEDAVQHIIYTKKGYINEQQEIVELPETAEITLWHPTMSSSDNVGSWQHWLIENEITQPFKQAHREIYIVTDAELNTQDYSLRFAEHLLKHTQFNALATQRGWRQHRGGSWDGGQENAAYKHIKSYGINVEFDATGARRYGENESGIYAYVSTQRVTFTREYCLDLVDVPAIVFSEVMRDVDLFVGVTSVGNDPDWQEREGTYWQSVSFGALSATAETRKQVLNMLIPKLKIASQLSLEGRFLIVRGNVRTYKIHLGSSNILMEPDNSYLCIVETKDKAAGVMLPFEGDRTLSHILSKAILLANDTKIKDHTILSQIGTREVVA